MKKFAVVFFLLICSAFIFAQAEGGESSAGGLGTTRGAGSSSADPYQFIVYSETRDNAQVDLAFNELTGVLRVTYVSNYSFNEGDALITVRNSVSAFARSKGYLKYRLYPDEDSISYREDGSVVLKRFYILYEKSGF